jgi:hypothetical protein
VAGAWSEDGIGTNKGAAYVFQPTPDITSINPTSAKRGETLNVTISGDYFDSASAVGFGAGVTVNSHTVDSSTQITANITVSGTATLGTRDVSVTTPIGSDTLLRAFTVTQALPDITSINPTSADRGDTLNVTITGDYFDSASAVSFGAGVTVDSYTVDSATQITATVTVSGTATVGTRDVSVTTPVGNDTLSASFTINSVSPNKPTNSTPANEATGISLTATLQSSAFSDTDPGDTHAASQWQITSTSADYSSPVYDSGIDTSNKTSITIPSATLSNNAVYYWRVRHKDSYGNWSDWSAETSFTTAGGGGGCGASAAAASASDIASGWGILGLLGVSGAYTGWRQKKRKTE